MCTSTSQLWSAHLSEHMFKVSPLLHCLRMVLFGHCAVGSSAFPVVWMLSMQRAHLRILRARTGKQVLTASSLLHCLRMAVAGQPAVS